MADNDQYHKMALSELDTGKVVAYLAARALAHAEGDQEKVASQYIRLRVAQLEREEQKHLLQNEEHGSSTLPSLQAVQAEAAQQPERQTNVPGYPGKQKKEVVAKKSTMLRMVVAAILTFNLCTLWYYDIVEWIPVVLTFVFAIIYELVIKKQVDNREGRMSLVYGAVIAVLFINIFTAYILSTQGNALAQSGSGVAYATGKVVLQNDGKVADQGHAAAQNNSGVAYADSQSVPQDGRKTAEWYQKDADQGGAVAQFNLGVRYANGRGVPQDDRKAAEWYQKAADQGVAAAQFNLGVRYANGRGVPQDDRMAVEWYRKAADQGYAAAQNNLGVMYNGRGVPQDDKIAVEWYQKAAAQGHAAAKNNLGARYASGRGVIQDQQRACELWREAAAKGVQHAVKWYGTSCVQ
jgi:TPR repeat protein